MGGWEHLLEAAADAAWGAFEGHEATADAAGRMLNVRRGAARGVGGARLRAARERAHRSLPKAVGTMLARYIGTP